MLDAIGGFPVVPFGVDVAVGARLNREGWRTRFVGAAVAENTVVSDLGDYWRQHVRWARGGFGASGHRRSPFRGTLPQRIETWTTTIGYGDRLVFAAAVVGAVVGVVPLWVAFAYLVAPGVELVAALLKAGIRNRLPPLLLAAAVLFAADLAASLAAIVVHLARRPYRWKSPRRQALGATSNR
jgi:cellulose synthase/poly-beta-1,6-N-acetylglucosamine synthase-like glycosyltransferase